MASSSGASSSSTPAAGSPGQSNSVQNPGPTKPEGRTNKGGILNSVDKGQTPAFGVKEVEERGTKVKGRTQEVSEDDQNLSPSKEPVKAAKEKDSSSAHKSPGDEAIALFEAEFGNKAAAKGNEEASDDTSTEKAPKDLSEDASKRFQNLANRAKQAETEKAQTLAQVQNFQQQVSQWSQQVNAQFNDMRVENARLQAQVEYFSKGGAVPQKDIDPIDALGEKLDPRFKKAVEDYVGPLKNELTQMRQERDRALKQQKVQSDQKLLNMHADRATSSTLLQGFDNEDAKGLRMLGGTLTMALAWAKGCSHDEAAKLLRDYNGKWALAYMKGKTKENKARMEQVDKLPPTTNAGRSAPSARGNGTPSWEDAKKAGYKNPLQMMVAKDRGE